MLEASNKQRRIRNSLSREEIRNVSLLILKEEGLEGLSMRKIANRLGCSVASPYSYYESQIDLVQDLIKSGEDELLSMLQKSKCRSRNRLCLSTVSCYCALLL